MMLLVFVVISLVLWGIFNLGTSEAKPTATKVSMEKLLNPQVLFVAGTSRDSAGMSRLIKLFRNNVERDHGKFIELENTDLNDGKED
jgi:hypothetical protein